MPNSTFAWFTASGAATITVPTKTPTTATVTADTISTSVDGIQVTLTFEEVNTLDNDGQHVLGLAHYYAEADNSQGGYGSAGWHQAYLTQGGTPVWDLTTGVTGDPYGVGANSVYRVYKVKASATLSPDQAANTPDNHTITGKATIADNCNDHNCAYFWSKASAITEDKGNPEAPQANLRNSSGEALAFANIDLSGWFGGASGAKTAYSTTYYAVMVDGAVHASGDITATLGFDSVTVA